MLKPETVEIQNRLARYCRTGEPDSLPGARNSRLHHYRRLVFNVIKNTIDQAYPVAREVIGGQEWHSMVDTFFREHDCQTPKVWMLPYEFYEFVKMKDDASRLGKPYLNDLLYFEWLEIEVHTMPDAEVRGHSENGDLMSDHLVVNPEHRIVRLDYPVHKIAAEKSIDKKGNHFLMVFREPSTGSVRFIDLSILHVFVLEKLIQRTVSLNKIVEDVCVQFGIDDRKLVGTKLRAFAGDMLAQKAILGFTNLS